MQDRTAVTSWTCLLPVPEELIACSGYCKDKRCTARSEPSRFDAKCTIAHQTKVAQYQGSFACLLHSPGSLALQMYRGAKTGEELKNTIRWRGGVDLQNMCVIWMYLVG